MPVIAAGLAEFVDVDGADVGDGFSFHPTPGHSVDHASIRLRPQGEEAWFLGDTLHHPLQVYRPELRSIYCEFRAAAERTRRTMLKWAAESGALPAERTLVLMHGATFSSRSLFDALLGGVSMMDQLAITAPTLIVHAEWDVDLSIDTARDLFSRLTGARYRRWVEIGAGTHMILAERNRWQAVSAITHFLLEDDATSGERLA